jgi:hypothetical protein
MNTYRTNFFATCPVNGVRVSYALEISTLNILAVEDILEYLGGVKEGLHESIASDLQARFGGHQRLTANHHSVEISTASSPTAEILAERKAQLARWPLAGDQQWTRAEWSALIARYATRSVAGDLRKIDVVAFRSDLVKTGALVLAALDALDGSAK